MKIEARRTERELWQLAAMRNNLKIQILPSVSQNASAAPMAYHLGELFCGAGGMALGASKARYKNFSFEHVWANDRNKDACKTFSANLKIAERHVVCKDVNQFEFGKVPKIDGLIFGFPCNDFSAVGERKGLNGEYGGLYIHGIRALRHFKPLFFVAENVGGLQSANKKQALNIIRCAMEDAGYEVSYSLYKFERYNVPQRRHRLFFVGFRKGKGIRFEHPKPSDKIATARAALNGIPCSAPNQERTAQNELVVRRLKCIKPGENAFTANLPLALQLHMKSGATISQIYKRLKADEPAYTVTGSGGGGTHIYHWDEPRALTNRERARLQTFPDDFEFHGGKESVRRQIGMAVPPKGAEIIFRQILKSLAAANVLPQQFV